MAVTFTHTVSPSMLYNVLMVGGVGEGGLSGNKETPVPSMTFPGGRLPYEIYEDGVQRFKFNSLKKTSVGVA